MNLPLAIIHLYKACINLYQNGYLGATSAIPFKRNFLQIVTRSGVRVAKRLFLPISHILSMENRGNELATVAPTLSALPVTVKEEPSEQNSSRQDTQQSQMQDVCAEEECTSDQRIECTTESQESEIRAFLSKCVFCSKIFTSGDDPKLLECLHAACTTCVNDKLSDHTSVDVDVLST